MSSRAALLAVLVLVAAVLFATGAWRALLPESVEAEGGPRALQLEGDRGAEDEALVPAGVEDDAERAAVTETPAGEAPATEVTPTSPEVAPEVSIVRARLVDEYDAPITGGLLRSIYTDGRPRGAGVEAQSGEDGVVELAIEDGDLRASRTTIYEMVFAASADGSATRFVVSTPKRHDVTDLGNLRLAPGGALSGTVVDSSGRPVAGALLYAGAAVVTGELERARIVGPDRDVVRPRTESGEDGRFELRGVEVGQRRLWAHAPGQLWTICDAVAVYAGQATDLGQVVLDEVPAAARITGVVLRPDGAPAARARVDHVTGGWRDGSVTADAEGRFLIVPVEDSPHELVARDAAREFSMSALVVATAGDDGVRLQLRERRVIAVLVTNSDGEPLERAALMPLLMGGASLFAGGGRSVPGEDWTRTDAAGRAEVPVPAETFQLTASLRGHEGQRLGPYEPETAPAELTIALKPQPRIAGRVTAYGDPVAGARITLGQRIDGFFPRQAGFTMRFFTNQNHGIVSDAEGRFACPVDPEWTDLTVLAQCDDHATGELELTVGAGEGKSDVEVEVTRGGVLTGAVLPPPGREAEGLVVAASRGDGHPVWTRVGPDGRYRLEGLTPGAWRVEGRDREPSTEILSVANRPDEKEFGWNAEVVDGVETVFDVDMRQLGDVEFHGRILVDGAAPAGWTAELVPPGDVMVRDAAPAVEVGADGTFLLVGSAGRHDLKLVGPLVGGARTEVMRELQVRGPRQDWELDLATGALSESVEPGTDEVRLVRGPYYEGDREITFVDVAPDGTVEARAPVGSSSLQTPVTTQFGAGWSSVGMVDVAR